MPDAAQRKRAGMNPDKMRAPLIYVCPRCHRNVGTRKTAFCKYCGSKFMGLQAIEIEKPTCAICGKKLKDNEIEKGICNRCEAITGIGHEEAF